MFNMFNRIRLDNQTYYSYNIRFDVQDVDTGEKQSRTIPVHYHENDQAAIIYGEDINNNQFQLTMPIHLIGNNGEDARVFLEAEVSRCPGCGSISCEQEFFDDTGEIRLSCHNCGCNWFEIL